MLNKPINPYPHNTCEDASRNIMVGFEIPNNEIIDGCYCQINNLETGEVEESVPPEWITPSNNIEFQVNLDELPKNGEHSWFSLYWKTPLTKKASSYVVTKVSDDGISIAAKGSSISTVDCDVTYGSSGKRYTAATNELYKFGTYSEFIFTSENDEYSNAHKLGDDTSKYCYKGNLEDYFGYAYIQVEKDLFNAVMEVGLGKCVVEIYGSSSKFLTRARVLAYDEVYAADFHDYYIIVDNNNISSECNELKRIAPAAGLPGAYSILVYDHIKLYNINDLDKDANMDSWLMSLGGNMYYLVSEFKFNEGDYSFKTIPSISSDLAVGDTVYFWSKEKADYNISPTYYFRTKEPPTFNIIQSKLQSTEGVNTLSDIKCDFGIKYTSAVSNLNCFYLYLYILDPQSYEWGLKERSPLLLNATDTYEFSGFVDGQKYKIVGVCTDKDGDEWTTENLEFTVNNPATLINTPSTFNDGETTVDVLLGELLKLYKTASLEFYRALKSDTGSIIHLAYSGGGLAKDDNAIYFNKWRDYNIRNSSCYDYYLRVSYVGKETDDDEGVDLWLVASDIRTEFNGTSILGLEKVVGAQLSITHNFNLLYHFDNNFGELKNEISREYLSSFSKYPKELKGNQNYLSGSCSGLLGSGNNGVYEEPRGIRDKWCSFVNDDTIKLYRGVDGETMIISIDSSSVKPYYFSNVGIVNEVKITFKEIASTSQYAIFTTEKIGG